MSSTLRSRVKRLEAHRGDDFDPKTLTWLAEVEARLAAHPEAAALEAELAEILERLAARDDLPAGTTDQNLFLLDPRARQIACDLDAIRGGAEWVGRGRG